MIHAGDAMIRDFLKPCDCQQFDKHVFGTSETWRLLTFWSQRLFWGVFLRLNWYNISFTLRISWDPPMEGEFETCIAIRGVLLFSKSWLLRGTRILKGTQIRTRHRNCDVHRCFANLQESLDPPLIRKIWKKNGGSLPSTYTWIDGPL